jgi:hypothetical protein
VRPSLPQYQNKRTLLNLTSGHTSIIYATVKIKDGNSLRCLNTLRAFNEISYGIIGEKTLISPETATCKSTHQLTKP